MQWVIHEFYYKHKVTHIIHTLFHIHWLCYIGTEEIVCSFALGYNRMNRRGPIQSI